MAFDFFFIFGVYDIFAFLVWGLVCWGAAVIFGFYGGWVGGVTAVCLFVCFLLCYNLQGLCLEMVGEAECWVRLSG